jgi:hypothetical protein
MIRYLRGATIVATGLTGSSLISLVEDLLISLFEQATWLSHREEY